MKFEELRIKIIYKGSPSLLLVQASSADMHTQKRETIELCKWRPDKNPEVI